MVLTIYLGVLSGVLTSALLFVAYVLKEKVFDPWFENRLYKGVMIDGTWTGKRVSHASCPNKDTHRPHHSEWNLQVDLKQSGFKVRGYFSATSIHAAHGDKDEYTNLYKIEGHVHDNFVVLEYHPYSRKRTGLGTLVLEVKNGGKTMNGHITFIEECEMYISTLENIVLKRKEEE